MGKMQFTDDQVAFDYVIYMMVGSYFDKTECMNTLQEKKMRLQYCEQKQANQYRMEELCIDYVEKELLPALPESFWHRQVQVYFVAGHGTGRHGIRFVSPEYTLCISGEYRGRDSRLFCKLFGKRKSGKRRTQKRVMQNSRDAA